MVHDAPVAHRVHDSHDASDEEHRGVRGHAAFDDVIHQTANRSKKEEAGDDRKGLDHG